MNSHLWRIIIGLVITVHGVGHIYFLIPSLGIASWGQTVQSWLCDSIAGGILVRPVAILVWSLATGIFIASGFGVWLSQGWWRDAAIAGAVFSLLGTALFLTGLPINPTINPVVVNIAVLVVLLLLKWPPTVLVGS